MASILLCRRFTVVHAVLSLALLSSCKKQEESQAQDNAKATADAGSTSTTGQSKKTSESPSAKRARELSLSLPKQELVQALVNPKKLTPYAGPTGSVVGTVKITGDRAPELPAILAKMEASCIESRAMFGQLFREGDGRTLADVLVAVTEYNGYLPIKDTDVPVLAKGCTYQSRTIAMTYGQRLVIRGLDNRPYVPEILGQPLPAQLYVLPTSPTVSIAPHRAGQFKLVDSMRLFNASELYILPYTTFDVTELDGRFEIKGIPVGKVKINALLPQTGAVAGQEILIEEGKATEVSFELSFDRAAWDNQPKEVPLDEIPLAEPKKK